MKLCCIRVQKAEICLPFRLGLRACAAIKPALLLGDLFKRGEIAHLRHIKVKLLCVRSAYIARVKRHSRLKAFLQHALSAPLKRRVKRFSRVFCGTVDVKQNAVLKIRRKIVQRKIGAKLRIIAVDLPVVGKPLRRVLLHTYLSKHRDKRTEARVRFRTKKILLCFNFQELP